MVYAKPKNIFSFQSLIWSLTERWRNWCWPIIKCKWLRLALDCTFNYGRIPSALNYCRIMTPTLVIACKWNWLESRLSSSHYSTDFLMFVKIEFDNVQFLPFSTLTRLSNGNGKWNEKLLTMLFPVTCKQSNSQQGFRSRSKISKFSFGKSMKDDTKLFWSGWFLLVTKTNTMNMIKKGFQTEMLEQFCTLMIFHIAPEDALYIVYISWKWSLYILLLETTRI